MMRFNLKAGLLIPLAGVLLLFTLFKFQPIISGQIRRPQPRPVRTATQPGQSGGLQFRLSEGAESKDQTPPNAVAPATPLSEAETAALLRRLPPLKAEPDDTKDFALRDRSAPPPRPKRVATRRSKSRASHPKARCRSRRI